MAYHSWKPNIELAPTCPRCYSSNTKFCYYNNYSLTQPRYFCKGCRRYWTKGGTLRNVPVGGGGCRKNRRGKSPRQAIHPMSHAHFSYSHELPDSYRSNHAHQDGVSKKIDLAPTEGSAIDLALIYTKFVNHSSELNSDPAVPELRGEVMEETFNAMDGAWNSAMNQMASQGLDRLGGGEITETPFENQIYTEDGDFSLDSGCSELATSFSGRVVTGNDFILSDCCVAPPTCQGSQPAMEDDVIHHQDLMLDDLCSLDQFYIF